MTSIECDLNMLLKVSPEVSIYSWDSTAILAILEKQVILVMSD